MRELISGTVKVFEAQANEEGLVLRTVFKGDGLGLHASVDPTALRRVLENLVSNAIKYTDAGSVTVTVERSDGKLLISVADTGRGIAARFHEEAFKKFSRLHLSTDSKERGTGLGLAISKGLVEANGGRIWMESEEGRGTTFHVELDDGVV